VPGVHLHAVEPRPPGPYGGTGEGFNDAVEVILVGHPVDGRRRRRGERPDHRLELRRCHHGRAGVGAEPGRDGGHEQRPAVGDVEQRVGAVVHQLGGDAGAVSVHPVGQLSEPRDEPVVRQRRLAGRVGPLGVRHGDRANHDKPDPAPSTRLEVGGLPFAHRSVMVGQTVSHGGQEDPVAQAHRSDGPGGEQMGKGCFGHGWSTSPTDAATSSVAPLGTR